MHISATLEGGPWDGEAVDFDAPGDAPGVIWGFHRIVRWYGFALIKPSFVYCVNAPTRNAVGPYMLVETPRSGRSERHVYAWDPAMRDVMLDSQTGSP